MMWLSFCIDIQFVGVSRSQLSSKIETNICVCLGLGLGENQGSFYRDRNFLDSTEETCTMCGISLTMTAMLEYVSGFIQVSDVWYLTPSPYGKLSLEVSVEQPN